MQNKKQEIKYFLIYYLMKNILLVKKINYLKKANHSSSSLSIFAIYSIERTSLLTCLEFP